MRDTDLAESAMLTAAVEEEVVALATRDAILGPELGTPQARNATRHAQENGNGQPSGGRCDARRGALIDDLRVLAEREPRRQARNAAVGGIVKTVAQPRGPLPQGRHPILHWRRPHGLRLWRVTIASSRLHRRGAIRHVRGLHSVPRRSCWRFSAPHLHLTPRHDVLPTAAPTNFSTKIGPKALHRHAKTT